jgi:perosamine synthetase
VAAPVLSYHRFDPGPCDFPQPRVPALPPLSWSQLSRGARAHGNVPVRRYARGRYALRAAYELAGVGPRGALLAPAYHCRTMLDGAMRLGADVALYPLTAELEPEPAGLERAVASCATAPAALLFTHYFGLPRDISPVALWCRERGIALIEDCSHALVIGLDTASEDCRIDMPMGRSGRYAASSPYKFHPCPDGGVLWSPQRAPLPAAPTHRPGWVAQTRGLWQGWRQASVRRASPSPAQVDPELDTLANRCVVAGRDWIETDPIPGLSPEYDPAEESLGSLAISRWIEHHADVGLLLQRRRERYAQWSDAVRDLTGCRPLFRTLSPGSTPYMFPLLVDEPPRRFYPLKLLGMPIWRWDDMAVSQCPVSQRYRQGVFHLPCHQAISDAEMDWMTAAVRRVMRT